VKRELLNRRSKQRPSRSNIYTQKRREHLIVSVSVGYQCNENKRRLTSKAKVKFKLDRGTRIPNMTALRLDGSSVYHESDAP
jgi:hypothetical protein